MPIKLEQLLELQDRHLPIGDKMKVKRFALVFVFALLVFSASAASAQELFYTGNVSMDSIVADVVIEETASVNLEYVLKNHSASEETVDLGFLQTGAGMKIEGVEILNPVVFDANEEKILVVSYTAEVLGGATKAFSFNPSDLTFNNSANANRTQDFFAQILLPDGIKKIVWANKEPYADSANENGRIFYTWQKTDSYATALSIKFSTLDIDLDVLKSVSPDKITDANQTIVFQITVENKGERELMNILLTDDYELGEFEVASNENDFRIPDINESEPRLLWVKEIDSISPGEKLIFSYSLKYLGDVSRVYNMRLNSCIVSVDGHLAGASNEPVLSKVVGLKNVDEESPPEPEETEENKGENGIPLEVDYSLASIVLLFVVVVGFLGFFFLKKR